jgi:hypothetical protein
MALSDLLDGEPVTAPGIALLHTALRQRGDDLRRQLDDAAATDPSPPKGKLEAIEKTKKDLAQIDAKLEHASDRHGEVHIGPALEQQVLNRLAPGPPKNEKQIADDLEEIDHTDVWDLGAWLNSAAESGLVEKVGDSNEVPLRRWAVTKSVSRREAYRQATKPA